MASEGPKDLAQFVLAKRIIKRWKKLGKKQDKLDARAELARGLDFLLKDNLPDALAVLDIAARISIDEHLKVVRDDAYTLSKLALALQDYTEQLDRKTSPKKTTRICTEALEALSQSMLVQSHGGGHISATFHFKRAVAYIDLAKKKFPRSHYYLVEAERDLEACVAIVPWEDDLCIVATGTQADVWLFLQKWDNASRGYYDAICLANEKDDKHVRRGLRKELEKRERYARRQNMAINVTNLELFVDSEVVRHAFMEAN